MTLIQKLLKRHAIKKQSQLETIEGKDWLAVDIGYGPHKLHQEKDLTKTEIIDPKEAYYWKTQAKERTPKIGSRP